MIEFIKEKYNAFAVFPYGSAVYGNKKPEDFDFVIVSDKPYFQENFEVNGIQYEISNYSKEEFNQRLREHEISVLECFYIRHKDKYISEEINDMFKQFSLSK